MTLSGGSEHVRERGADFFHAELRSHALLATYMNVSAWPREVGVLQHSLVAGVRLKIYIYNSSNYKYIFKINVECFRE